MLWFTAVLLLRRIRTEEERFSTAFRAAPIAFGMTSLEDGRIVEVNDAFVNLLGYSREELIGRRPADLDLYASPSDRVRMLELLQAGGSLPDFPTILRTKPGELRQVTVSSSIIAMDGTPHLLATVVDVTDRKRAEAALRESEARLNEAQHNARIGSWCYRAGGSLTMSDEMYDLYGLPLDMPATYEMVTASVHPDDRARNHNNFQNALESGACDFQDEYRLIRPDGEVRNIFALGKIRRGEDGALIEAVGTVQDVTERKEAEDEIRRLHEELRSHAADLEQHVLDRTAELEDANAELRHRRAELQSLFESLPGLYLILTPDLEIVAASDAYLKATLTTRDGIIGHDLFDIFPDNPDDAATTAVSNMRASLDRVIRNGAPDTMAIQKHDVRGPDGAFVERYWSPVNSPMFGAGHELKYIVHRVEEVTEFMRQKTRGGSDTAEFRNRLGQMEAEVFQSAQQVQAANLQLEAANKELEAFSYSVSHDLRAPLRAINGFGRILTEDHGDKLDAEGRRLLDVIRAEASRMGRLIDELLQFSRLGRRPLKKSATDMTGVAREVYEELRVAEPGRTVDFRLDALPAAPADPALLRQVWINLLGNALKFTRNREHADVVVSGSVQSGEAVYAVGDNGAGFDMRYADKLFGVFQRLHGVEEFEGTGVGLALVQRIVNRHGGRVWAEGALDRGATFSFSLPLSETSPGGAALAGEPGGATSNNVVQRS